MNPRALSPTVPATALLPGDRIFHPTSGAVGRVSSVNRAGDEVVVLVRGAAPVVVGRSFRISLVA